MTLAELFRTVGNLEMVHVHTWVSGRDIFTGARGDFEDMEVAEGLTVYSVHAVSYGDEMAALDIEVERNNEE